MVTCYRRPGGESQPIRANRQICRRVGHCGAALLGLLRVGGCVKR